MTVKQMVEALLLLPEGHQVIVDLHSEWALAAAPTLVTGFDNGGYISEPRFAKDPLKVHGYVYIGVDNER